MRYFVLMLVALAAPTLGVPAARAQAWTDIVFPERSRDFGTVARGSRLHHAFRLVNTTNQEIHIATYRTKCGCTEVRLGAQTIPPGTQTVVEAVLDTTKFTGTKDSGLTLVLDRPAYQEVDLRLHCFIRGDITLVPGQADFGVVNRANKPVVAMTLTYAGGQPDWAITKIQTLSPNITVRAEPPERSTGSPLAYALTATLNPTAPVGFLKEEVTLFTNDPTSPAIPISVTAVVQSNVTVTPSVMTLGAVRAGEAIERVILVKSAQPFRVVAARANQPELTATAASDKPAPFHQVKLLFKAPARPGPFHAVVEVETDVNGEPPAKVNAFATVVP